MKSAISHPKALSTFFATEMWERYGFYAVQTLLALFLATHFRWNDHDVYALVGSFTALTYVSPVVGGWIADHLIGQKRAIIAGAVILLLCYFFLAWSACDLSSAMMCFHVDSRIALTLPLAGIAVGTGLLKPNISSLLGNSYPDGSPARESGFTIFYMGITSGIIFGSTLPGIFQKHFGWSSSFISASVGMIIAIAVFVFGVKKYSITDYTVHDFTLKKVIAGICLTLVLGVGAFFMLNKPSIADTVFLIIAALSFAYFIYIAKFENSVQQLKQNWVIGLLCIISILFWALYFQMFLSLTLFISRVVEPTFMGIAFPAPYYVSIQSIGAIVFGYFLSKRHASVNLNERGIQAGKNFVLSMGYMSVGYVIIVLCSKMTAVNALISPVFIVIAYLMISLAELHLYPVGLAAVTILASRTRVSTMMGVFFVSLGIGGYLSGKLAFFTAVTDQSAPLSILKPHYTQGFSYLLMTLLLALGVSVLLNKRIQRLLAHGVI